MSPHIIFVASNSLVQAILIMGGQWMMKVNNGLDDLEGDIKSLKIPADDMKALREEQEKHKVNKHVYIVNEVWCWTILERRWSQLSQHQAWIVILESEKKKHLL